MMACRVVRFLAATVRPRLRLCRGHHISQESHFHTARILWQADHHKTLIEPDTNHLGDNSLNCADNTKSYTETYRDKLQFTENFYIYRHIHRRLDRFAGLETAIATLRINDDIKGLRQVNEKDKITRKKIMGRIAQEIKSLNQQELAILLTGIKNDYSDDFKQVRRLIDLELRWLLKKHVKTRLMDLDLWFYIADIFYECLTKSVFVRVFVDFLANENDIYLSNKQFIHLLFLVILQRDVKNVLINYEERIHKIIAGASFEDLATIAMAYFKTKTKIENPTILGQLIDKTCDLLPSIDPTQPGFCSIIKSVRYSSLMQCRENVRHLIMTLISDSEGKVVLSSVYNTVHTVKLMEAYRIYDKQLLDYLAETMFDYKDEFRIKDVQYGLTSLSNFSYQDLRIHDNFKKNLDKLCIHMISELRSDADRQYFHMMPILRAFSIFGYYNNSFINYVNAILRDHRKLDIMSRAIEFEKTALLVYTASRVEGSGCTLGDDAKLYRSFSSRVDRSLRSGPLELDSLSHQSNVSPDSTGGSPFRAKSGAIRALAHTLAARDELKSCSFAFQYTLAHQNYMDLIITKSAKLPGDFCPRTLMPKSVPEGEKHCLIYAISRFDYVDGYTRLSGYKRLFIRLLERIGYDVVCVETENPDVELIVRKIVSSLGNH